MAALLLARIKLALRIKHDALDEDIEAEIYACLADLQTVGVVYADAADPLIFAAVKLWCKAAYTDDIAKSAEYMSRYNAMKASLMMAEGYAWEGAADE
jgi:hypothetical protein